MPVLGRDRNTPGSALPYFVSALVAIERISQGADQYAYGKLGVTLCGPVTG